MVLRNTLILPYSTLLNLSLQPCVGQGEFTIAYPRMDTNILDKELIFKTSRSSGSGGQHVNKTETRVEVRFDLDASEGLTATEQRRIRKALGKRISQSGILAVASSSRRSQVLNKKEAVNKFYRLLKKALRRRPKRKGPKPLKANPVQRLRDKKRHAEKKALRGKVEW